MGELQKTKGNGLERGPIPVDQGDPLWGEGGFSTAGQLNNIIRTVSTSQGTEEDPPALIVGILHKEYGLAHHWLTAIISRPLQFITLEKLLMSNVLKGFSDLVKVISIG